MTIEDIRKIIEQYPQQEVGVFDAEHGLLKCPHCGKPMRKVAAIGELRREVYYEGDEDTWGFTQEESVPTWKCDDCGIKYTTHKYEWVFPKSYKKSISQKQEDYINGLVSNICLLTRIQYVNLYITSGELAHDCIETLLPIVKQLKTKNNFKNMVTKKLEELGYSKNSFNSEEVAKIELRYECDYKDDQFKDIHKYRREQHFSDDNNFKISPIFKINWESNECTISYSLQVDTLEASDLTKLANICNELDSYRNEIQSVLNNLKGE